MSSTNLFWFSTPGVKLDPEKFDSFVDDAATLNFVHNEPVFFNCVKVQHVQDKSIKHSDPRVNISGHYSGDPNPKKMTVAQRGMNEGYVVEKGHQSFNVFCSAVLLSLVYWFPRTKIESELDWSDPTWTKARDLYCQAFEDRVVFSEMIGQLGGAEQVGSSSS